MKQIPLRAIPNQKFKVILNNQECTLHFYQKSMHLYFDLKVKNTDVCKGTICQNEMTLVQNAQYLFEGNLVFFDLQGDSSPQFDGLNSRFILIYFAKNEAIRPYKV